MNGIEQVKNALAKKLAEGGITAVDAWSRRGLPQLEKAVVVRASRKRRAALHLCGTI